MRKYLITAGAVLLLAVPALAQSVTTETKSKTTTVEGVAPAPLAMQPVPVPVPEPTLPGSAAETHSSTIHSGASGMSRTDRSTETYIGTDGMVHENKTIQHEEAR